MKLLLPILFIPLLSLSQLQVRQTSNLEIIGTVSTPKGYVELSRVTGSLGKLRDTSYVIFYKNEKNNINRIEFRDIDGTLDKLYRLLMSFYNQANIDNKGYMAHFKLGETNINVSRYGNKLDIDTRDGYFYLDKSGIKKLFNR